MTSAPFTRGALCGTLLLGILLSLPASASTISNIQFLNTSPADFTNSNGGRITAFASSGSATTPISFDNTVFFTSNFNFDSLLDVAAGGPTVANILLTYASYEVRFRVDDPNNFGYEVTVDTAMRGYLTAMFDGFVNPSNLATNITTVSGPSFAAYADTGSGYGSLINALTLNGTLLGTSLTDPSRNLLVEDNGTYSLGNFVGTREFGLRFSSNPSPTVSHTIQNNATGSTAARFGLDLGLPGTAAEYPGPDGEFAGEQGHFLSVAVTFQNGSDPGPGPNPGEVPEPSTYALLGAGLLGMGLLHRRK
jgi:hypothetical protein